MSRVILVLISLILITEATPAQPVTPSTADGYRIKGDTTYFVFNPADYGLSNVQKVVVTGAFRGWSQDMNDANWFLKKNGDYWTLAVSNFEFRAIPPASPFKFRINDGTWLNPPASASNEEGGNLIFMKGSAPPRLIADIVHENAIWVQVTGEGADRPLDPSAYKLTRFDGQEIKVAELMPHEAHSGLLIPEKPIDPKRVHYVEIPGLELKVMATFDGWFRTLYSTKALGANISDDEKNTDFRIFSPRAEKVKLYLYKGKDDAKAYKTIEMKRDNMGVWEHTESGNLFKTWYDFTVHGPKDEPGSNYYEKIPVHVSDPYARVSDDTWGKSRVWTQTRPAKPLKNGRPKMEDVIAYEVHVQDFTDRLPVADNLKGTIPAMGVSGLKNSKGMPIGFDHLVDLGINVVHLMPVQEYLHYPDAEWQAAFKDDPYMIEQGIAMENYQWGYRTSHAMAVETRFRDRNTDHGDQRDQFRDLVEAFHEKDMAVIVDYVFNHTAEDMDGRDMYFNFKVLDQHYYYRTKDGELIGEYGNETKSENRPMMQRWFIDQCLHYIHEFGVDGFRIDLAGQTDEQTLLKLRQAVGDDIIIYGEPWIASKDPDYENNPSWDWYKVDAPLTFFQDDARNTFKGPTSNPTDKAKDRGYAGGDYSLRDRVKLALTDGFMEEREPNRGINYLDIHDNWTLADQFGLIDWDGRRGVDEGPYKIAITLLSTSVGPIVLHGGSEFMRSKGHAPLIPYVKETETGKIWIHGKRDSYNLRTANHFVWEDVGKTKDDACSYFDGQQAANDYANMHAFWRGMIKFRLSDMGQIFRISKAPPKDYYQWIEPENPYLLGYLVDKKVLVLINTENKTNLFNQVVLPDGNWKLIANDQKVDVENGITAPDFMLRGNRSHDLTLPATSVKIWVKE